ncbi:uncharacterized protein LOC143041818 [Oratosquilla oratoria]|uniref:uncharacterized protein LOC143041818 n=1 Tax=Oratosquilla oratoria TaxID=337810 RepID=UPI003F75AA1C
MESSSLGHDDDRGDSDEDSVKVERMTMPNTRDHCEEDQYITSPRELSSPLNGRKYRSSKPDWWQGQDDDDLQGQELRPGVLQRPSATGLPTLFPALPESVLHLWALRERMIAISSVSATSANTPINSTAGSTHASTTTVSCSGGGTVACSSVGPTVSSPISLGTPFSVANVIYTSPTVVDIESRPTTSCAASHPTSSSTLRAVVPCSGVTVSTFDNGNAPASSSITTSTNATACSSVKTSTSNSVTMVVGDSITTCNSLNSSATAVSSTSTAASTDVVSTTCSTIVSSIDTLAGTFTTATMSAPSITIVGTSTAPTIVTVTSTADNVISTTVAANSNNSSHSAVSASGTSNSANQAAAPNNITRNSTDTALAAASTITTTGVGTSITSINTVATTTVALSPTVAGFHSVPNFPTDPKTYVSVSLSKGTISNGNVSVSLGNTSNGNVSVSLSKGNISESSATCTSGNFVPNCCSTGSNSPVSAVFSSRNSTTNSDTMTASSAFSTVNVSDGVSSVADPIGPPAASGSPNISAGATTSSITMATVTTTTTTISTSLSGVASSSPGFGILPTPSTTIASADATTAIVPPTIISVMASSNNPHTTSSLNPPSETPLRRILTRSQTGTTVGSHQSRVLKLATTYPTRNRQPKRPRSRNSDTEDYIPPNMCRSRSRATSRVSSSTPMDLAPLPFTSPRSCSSSRTATVMANTQGAPVKHGVQTFTRDIDPSNEFLYIKNPSGTGIEFGNMCSECGVVTVTSISFRRHREAHGETGFACGFCPHVFLTAVGQERHVELHHNGTHHDIEDYCECGLCGGSFISVMYLEFHILELHGADYLKNQAQEIILVGQTYSRHNINDSGQGEGEVGVGLRRIGRGRDEDEMDNDTDEDNEDVEEQPYQCGICAMQFFYSLNLDCHMVLHTEVSYMCATCHAAFPSLDPLTLHVKTVCSRRQPLCTQSSPNKKNHSYLTEDADHKGSAEVSVGITSPTSAVTMSSTRSFVTTSMPTSAVTTSSTFTTPTSSSPIVRSKLIACHLQQQNYPKVEVVKDEEEEHRKQLLLLQKQQESQILQQQQLAIDEAGGSYGNLQGATVYSKPMNTVHTLPSGPFWSPASAYPSGLNPVLTPQLTPVGGNVTPGLTPLSANISPSMYNYYMMMSVWPNAGSGMTGINSLPGEVAKSSGVHPEILRQQQQQQQQYLDSLASSGSSNLYAGNSAYSPSMWPSFFNSPVTPVFGCGPYIGETRLPQPSAPPPPHTSSHPQSTGSAKTKHTHKDDIGSCHQNRKGSMNMEENDVSVHISREKESQPKQEIEHEGR